MEKTDTFDWARPKVGVKGKKKTQLFSPNNALWIIMGDCPECSGDCADDSCSWDAAAAPHVVVAH